ncbi:MAG: DUF3299 domain-containing protein [Betaproteobacteria bacterium]|nr:DUF3299 domain-containing protein [Betaproteobacteria bacterium]
MYRPLAALCLSLFVCFAPPAFAEGPKVISWDDLMNVKWAKEIQAEMLMLGRLGFLKDGSQQAEQAMSRIRQKWDAAPVVETYAGQRIKIVGYVVPLEASRDVKREFLLVPYFGACIHSPPPPANQIILVSPAEDSAISRVPESMSTVWVEGVLQVNRTTTSQGVTGYQIQAERVSPYRGK